MNHLLVLCIIRCTSSSSFCALVVLVSAYAVRSIGIVDTVLFMDIGWCVSGVKNHTKKDILVLHSDNNS